MEDGLLGIISKMIESGVLGDSAGYIFGIMLALYLFKQVGSPAFKLFESLCKKSDVEDLSDKINSIEKSIEDIQRVLDNNVDNLKSKLDASSSKLNELENVTSKNKVELSDVSDKITSIRNVLDSMAIQQLSSRRFQDHYNPYENGDGYMNDRNDRNDRKG